MSDLSAWLLSIGAFAGIVICTAYAAKAIAGDPPRGRRRCPRCWHELGPADPHNPALHCAECGHRARDEADVTRNRRELLRAALAVLGVIAIATAARVRLLDRGAWSMAPTSVLLMATPSVSGGGYRSAAWELAYRVRSGAASDAQAREAFELFLAGDADARPPSQAWRTKYRDLGSAAMARLGPADPLMARLLEIPPSFDVSALSGCALPSGDGAPPLLVLDAECWWPAGVEGRLELAFADGSRRFAEYRPEGRFPALVIELPADARTGDEVTLTLSHRTIGSVDPGSGWQDYPAVSTKVPPLSGVTAMPWAPADGDELRRTVAAVFEQGLVLWSAGSPRGGLRFDHRVTGEDLFGGMALGLRVEVCEHGTPRRTSRMWWTGGSAVRQPRWLPTLEDADAMQRLYEQMDAQLAAREGRATEAEPERPAAGRTGGMAEGMIEGWTLRITGDERLAHYAALSRGERTAVAGDASTQPLGAEGKVADKAADKAADKDENDTDGNPAGGRLRRWFAGTIEVPLRIERMPSPAPVRRWKVRESVPISPVPQS